MSVVDFAPSKSYKASKTSYARTRTFADIVIEMAIAPGLGELRRRRFTGVGRYPETLQSVTAELNLEETDYVLLPYSPPPAPPLLAILHRLLVESPFSSRAVSCWNASQVAVSEQSEPFPWERNQTAR